MRTRPRHALDLPPGLDGDPNAFEMARIWAAHGRQVVALSLDPELDPAAWGLMLVDLARHISRAYEQSGRTTAAAALQRVMDGVKMELANPTDLGTGSLV